VEKAKVFHLKLPRTYEEQPDNICSILELDLDGIDLDQWMQQIKKMGKTDGDG
jgi:hypothetical protein